jgi:hypothetical protein
VEVVLSLRARVSFGDAGLTSSHNPMARASLAGLRSAGAVHVGRVADHQRHALLGLGRRGREQRPCAGHDCNE